MQELLNDAKKYFQGKLEGDPVQAAKERDCLMVDDLGMEQLTDWSWHVIHNLLNYRYNEMLPTIIATNFGLADISNYLQDTRLPDRLYQMCKFVKFDGESLRDNAYDR